MDLDADGNARAAALVAATFAGFLGGHGANT
jgi:hypothetical protein